MTNEEKIEKILEMQSVVFGALDQIRSLMTREVMSHCEAVLEKDDSNTDALHIVGLKEDLQEYSRMIPELR